MDKDSTNKQPLHRRLRDARRRAGLTQAELASRVDCMQSAISMMEGGRMTALARTTLEKIGALLNVDIGEEPAAPEAASLVPANSAYGFCPNFDCPSNIPFLVGEELLLLPRGMAGDGKHCAICGEVMVRACQFCESPVKPGSACCANCGSQLVPSAQFSAPDLWSWVAERQQLSRSLGEWLMPRA